MTTEKSVDILLKVGNPVGYIFERAIDAAFPSDKKETLFKRNLKNGAKFIGNPVVFGLEKLVEKSRSRKNYLP
jgi:hypothetical protein